MEKHIDKNLVRRLLMHNYFIIIIYTVLLLIASFISGAYSLMISVLAIFAVDISVLVSQQTILAKHEVSSENTSDDKSTYRQKSFNSFILTLYIKTTLPVIAVIPISAFGKYLCYAILYKKIDSVLYYLKQSFYIQSVNFFAVVLILAAVVFIWTNFKTTGLLILHSFVFIYSILNSTFFSLLKIRGYLPGIYLPFDIINYIMIEIKGTRNNYMLFVMCIVILLSLLLLSIAKRRYIKNPDRNPGRVLLYSYIVTGSILSVLSFYMPVYQNIFSSVLKALIKSLIICLPIYLIAVLKKFNFFEFIKRFSLCFLIISAAVIGLRYGAPGFINHIPDSRKINYVEINVSGSDIFEQDKTYRFESIEAIEAVKSIHKKLIENEKSMIEGKVNKASFICLLDYHIKPFGDIKRQYFSGIDFYNNSQYIHPLLKTPEFKKEYYSLLNEDCKIYFIGSLDKNSDIGSSRGIITIKNKVLLLGLKSALEQDIKKNSLDFIADKNTKYIFSVQPIMDGKEPKTEVYHIPEFYRYTVEYLRLHSKEISDS